MAGAFCNLLSDMSDWCPSRMRLGFQRIDGVEAARLEEDFTEEEVFASF